MSETQTKLQRGIDNLQDAGNNPDLLGVALLVFHAALEDHFRDVLESTSALPATQRARVRDKRQVQWMQLVDLMQQYHRLSNTHRHWILSTNRFRQEFAHGSKFNGNRREVERYGAFVRTQINGSGSSRPIVNRRQPNTSSHSTQAAQSRTENVNQWQPNPSTYSIHVARLRAEKQFRGNSAKWTKFGCLAFGPFLFLAVMIYIVSRPSVSVRDRPSTSQSSKQGRVTLSNKSLSNRIPAQGSNRVLPKKLYGTWMGEGYQPGDNKYSIIVRLHECQVGQRCGKIVLTTFCSGYLTYIRKDGNSYMMRVHLEQNSGRCFDNVINTFTFKSPNVLTRSWKRDDGGREFGQESSLNKI